MKRWLYSVRNYLILCHANMCWLSMFHCFVVVLLVEEREFWYYQLENVLDHLDIP